MIYRSAAAGRHRYLPPQDPWFGCPMLPDWYLDRHPIV